MRCSYRWRRQRTPLLKLCLFGAVAYVIWSYVTIAEDSSTLKFRRERYLQYQRGEMNRTGPGEMGRSVSLTKEETQQAKILEKMAGFNILVSDKIALDRSLPDYRRPECLEVIYPTHHLTTSVVIIFHNEAWSPVLRTVFSVVNRSPPSMLKEVLLVDDASTNGKPPFSIFPPQGSASSSGEAEPCGGKMPSSTLIEELLGHLDEFVKKTWPDGIVKIVRVKERSGLIRARLAGSEHATGDVLVFLDAHCETSKGWLEPILGRIAESRKAVLVPTIDNIFSSTMTYNSGAGSSVGSFWWGLHFGWMGMQPQESRRRQSDVDTIRTPTMPGGLLAIERNYFFEMGTYDAGMEIWGGENLEMSFRVWMCGGTIEMVPCSHVGHIFRATHPYGFPDKKRDYHGINSKRLAEVWMDDYKRMFYMQRKNLRDMDVGDLTERHQLRKRLKCHDFAWYLKNVFPEKYVLDMDSSLWGTIKNPDTNMCLDTLGADEKYKYPIGIYPCQISYNQVFTISKSGQFRREQTCASRDGDKISMHTCWGNELYSTWTYDHVTMQMKTTENNKCMSMDPDDKYPLLVECDPTDSKQKWQWELHDWLTEN